MYIMGLDPTKANQSIIYYQAKAQWCKTMLVPESVIFGRVISWEERKEQAWLEYMNNREKYDVGKNVNKC